MEEIPYRTDDIITAAFLIKLLVVFVFIGIAALGVAYFLKRYYYGTRSRGQGSTGLVIEEIRRVTPKLIILSVSYQNKIYLIAQNEQQIVKLDELTGSNKEYSHEQDSS